VYESRRVRDGSDFNSCLAFTLQKHASYWNESNENEFRKSTCAVVVLNRAGAGVCLRWDSANSVPKYAFISEDSDALSLMGWGSSNKFMWRQLVRKAQVSHRGNDPDRPTFRQFSPKCYSSPICARSGLAPSKELYLPNREVFFP
jgi:hypothetical protein